MIVTMGDLTLTPTEKDMLELDFNVREDYLYSVVLNHFSGVVRISMKSLEGYSSNEVDCKILYLTSYLS